MTSQSAPQIKKWPFYLGDLFLLAVAGWIVFKCPDPFRILPLLSLVVCASVGAWISITPFLIQHRADMKFSEANQLASTVSQINNLGKFTNQISFATAQWQIVQEQSAKTVTTAREVSERMTAEAKSFSEFMLKANDSEKAHLRLENDKLRRLEGDWLQIIVRMLDHVYALYRAGMHSGQPNVIEQLSHFQAACRDAVRRIGLLPFEAEPGEAFNEKTHQPASPEMQPPPGARIQETVATGFTYQGQMIRQALVVFESEMPRAINPLPGSPAPVLGVQESELMTSQAPNAPAITAQPQLFQEEL
ncbi:MAG TPA: nucleotide exchange factor GrpE [Verrucomicrobiae bacterium]|jgi:molecular chaperone GrpE (heat shock protein)